MNQKKTEKKRIIFHWLISVCILFSVVRFLPISFSEVLGAMPEKINILEEVPGTRIPIGRFTINYYRFFFIDKKRGWFTARDRIGMTEDGGRTWKINSLGLLGEPTFALFFLNKDVGWYADFDWVLRTLDGGKTWKRIMRYPSKPEDNLYLYVFDDLYFINENSGWGISGAELYQTEDGGLTWTKRYKIHGRGHLNSISFVDTIHGGVGGTDVSGSFVLSTKDGGKSWQKTDIGKGSIKYLTFLDAENGWAVGWKKGLSDQHEGLILRTSDGGNTWKEGQLPPGTDMPIRFIYMKNKQEGWAAGRMKKIEEKWTAGRGVLLHTQDGGATWQIVATKPEEEFIYVTLVEQDKRPALLIASEDAIYRMFLE